MGNIEINASHAGVGLTTTLVSFSERTSEPSYFQRPSAVAADPVDAEVIWFNSSKGFGFVKLSDGIEVYLHARVLEAAGSRGVSEGTRLQHSISPVESCGTPRCPASREACVSLAGPGRSKHDQSHWIFSLYRPPPGFRVPSRHKLCSRYKLLRGRTRPPHPAQLTNGRGLGKLSRHSLSAICRKIR